MKFYNVLSDFLYDKKYFITIFENKIHVFRYRELLKLSSETISLQIENFKLVITGRNLTISQMNGEEIIIQGTIDGIRNVYE